MTRSVPFCLCILVCVALAGRTAAGQQLAPDFMSKQWRLERVGEDHLKFVGDAEVEWGDVKFYADEIEIFTKTDQLVASGSVVFVSGSSRIAADRVEFNMKTRTGVFHQASGSASLADQAQPVDLALFGGQEPDVYFYGETLEKVGPRRYRIAKGGFTTCVQPTPRWELTSTSVVLNLDDYAVLRHTVFRVKSVPVFYLPILYYPMQEDERATGLLMPTYGASVFRGQTISNAFFWAISRSQDATMMHDWFSRTGQGVGAEYRYVSGPGSQGTIRTYWLNEHEAAYTVTTGGTTTRRTTPARRSYEIRGSATQVLPKGLRARANVDYFSDITVQQTYHGNIYDTSRRSRTYGGNVTGDWGAYNLSGTFLVGETFFGNVNSTLVGGAPRIAFSRGQRPLGRLPIYVSAGGEYVRHLREQRSPSRVIETGLSRVDFNPLVRIPFTTWPFLTINSSIAWRLTHWTESRGARGVQVDAGLTRRYFDFQSQIVGPVFTRIWNTPNSGYAERFKHVIEPTVTLQRLTAIDNFDRIVQLEAVDSIVGSTTRVGYGISNRVYAKRRLGGATGVPREIVNVGVFQSYYTDARAAQFDRLFRTSFNGTLPSHFSPVSITARVSPSDAISGTLRAEYDTQFGALRTIGANGTYARGGWLQTTAGWSQRRFIEKLPGFNDRSRLDHFFNQSTTLRTPGNRVGGIYLFNYDLLRNMFLQQRLIVYYNAQCCGVSVEWQSFNFQGLGARVPVPQDRRFNFSFTLAGLGSFANFFGALAGQPGR